MWLRRRVGLENRFNALTVGLIVTTMYAASQSALGLLFLQKPAIFNGRYDNLLRGLWFWTPRRVSAGITWYSIELICPACRERESWPRKSRRCWERNPETLRRSNSPLVVPIFSVSEPRGRPCRQASFDY